MWMCQRCGKPVYFGQHAQHKSSPYCHIPCYAALFGPNLFGHGSTTESHRSFGNRSKSFIRLETELSNKVKEYNRYYNEYPRCQLTVRQVNGRLVLEGVLRIYWGTDHSIRLKQYEDNRVINRHKKTLSLGHHYANIEYDSDDTVPVPPTVPPTDPSLFFPPQLGDLTLHVFPGLGDDSSQSNELQKWETLTTLDKESKPNLNVQLLESLIENKSLKLTTKSNILQRSQSVKASSFEAKHKTSRAKYNKKRFSCNLSDLKTDIAAPSDLNAIKEDLVSNLLNKSPDIENRNILDSESNSIEWPNTKPSTNATNCDINHELTVQDENLTTTNDELNDNIEHEKADNDCETPTNIDGTIDDINISAQDELNANFAEAENNQSNFIKSSTDEDTINENEEICIADNDKLNALDSFIDNDFDNVSSSNNEENGNLITNISDSNDDTSEYFDAIEQTSILDESINNSFSTTVGENDTTDAKDDNGNIELETVELNLQHSNVDTNLQEESFEETKKKVTNHNSRRPSVEFNVYSPRAPPKIKKSPMKFSSLFEAESSGKGISPLTTNEPITGPDIIESVPKTPVISSSEVTEQKLKDETNNDGLSEEAQKVELRHKKIKSPNKEGEGTGPRALRRRKGRMTRIRRRSSINGHWYDRETAVFTPPKDAVMSVWTTSLQSTSEVLSSILSKYKIESEVTNFGLYVVKETGETRLLADSEFPLLLRANLGPHEDISKIYVMNKQTTNEISAKVADYLKFSWAELRAFVNMFYEEEEREADAIRFKYHQIRKIMTERFKELESEKTLKMNESVTSHENVETREKEEIHESQEIDEVLEKEDDIEVVTEGSESNC